MIFFSKTAQAKKRMASDLLQVRPVYNPAGEERFGAIELPASLAATLPGDGKRRRLNQPVYTGGLRLSGSGLNLWLADDEQERTFWHNLTCALPDGCAAQFILQRRPGTLKDHYEAIQDQVQQQLGDPETTYVFLKEYLENLLYPVEEAGLAVIKSFLLVSARSEEDLGDTLAGLFAALPCDASPLLAADLEDLLLEYGLFTPQDYFDDYLELEASERRAYWTLSAPPQATEGGWTRRLLESEDLYSTGFDIVAHLTPGKHDPAMEIVLKRRLEALSDMLDSAVLAGAEETTKELSGQLALVERKLATIEDRQHRFYEVSLSLGLRSTAEDFATEVEDFEQVLLGAKLAPRRIIGVPGLELAWKDLAPLNSPQLARSFIVGEQPSPQDGRSAINSAGRLAQLGIASAFEVSNHSAPLVGYSRAGEAFQLESGPGLSLFLTGQNDSRYGESARNLVKYLVSMERLRGEKFLIVDPNAEWQTVIRQFGNPLLAHFSPYRLADLLEADPAKLATIAQIERWQNRTLVLLDALLDLGPEKETLEGILLAAVLDLLNEKAPLTAESLWQRSMDAGQDTLTRKLSRLILDGDLAWLLLNPQTEPVYVPELLSLNFDYEEMAVLAASGRKLILGRALAKLIPVSAEHTLVIDQAHLFLSDPESFFTISQLVKTGRKIWLIFPTTEELLTAGNGAGRWLLEMAQTSVIFRQDGPGLNSFANRQGLSSRAVKAIRELAAGGALVRRRSEDRVQVSAFEPLPGDYTARLSGRPSVERPGATKFLPSKTQTAVA